MRKLLLTLSLFSLPFGGIAQKNTEKQIDRLFEGRFSDQTPGVAIAVLSEDKVVFSKAYGSENLEYGIPLKHSTVFDIASLSKQFTAFSIAMLADSGKLSLDDDIRKYIPELHDFGETITIRHLLGHTSGLRDQNDLLNLLGYRDGDIIANEHVLRLIFKQKQLSFSPGKQFLYCNSGYTLLAQIVERVTKVPFPEWTQRHIFSPLGMKHTFFMTDYGTVIPGKAYSYAKAENGFRKVAINSTNNGARGLQSTTEDLCLWVKNFSEKRVGSDSVLRWMNTAPESNYRLKYAFGQAFGSYKGTALIEHDGSDAGYRTYIGRFPGRKLAVIMLGNLESLNARNTGLQIADIFLGAASGEPSAPEKLLLPDHVEAMLEGQYQISPNMLLTIWADDHVIRATVNNEIKEYYFKPLTPAVLSSEELRITLKPKKGRVGEPDSVAVQGDLPEATVPKIFVPSPGREQLKEFEGEYFSEELSVAYRLYLKNNDLVAELPRSVQVRLRKRETDDFSGSYYWFKQLKFLRNDKNEVNGFEVSSGRSFNIGFVKTK